MEKTAIESFRDFLSRKHVNACRRVAILTVREQKHVPQVPKLTPRRLDELKHRRLDAEAARRKTMHAVFGKKNKLPLPVFACESGGTS